MDTLDGVSFTLVGNDAELNWAFAQALAARIGWFPVQTSKVMQGMHKVASMEELEQRDGIEKLGERMRS